MCKLMHVQLTRYLLEGCAATAGTWPQGLSTTCCLGGRTNITASKLGTEAHLDVDSKAAGSAREHLAASRQQAGLCLVKCIDVCILRTLRKMQGTAWATGLSIHSPSSIARFQERVG